MSSLELMSVLLLSCLITGTWLSLRSWMRSLQSLVSAQSLLRAAQIQGLEERQQEQQRHLLWEAMQPLAEVLQRLDHHQQLTRKRVQVMQVQQVELRSQQEQLLLEILQAMQPSALTQLSPLIGQPSQPPSSQPLVS